LNFVEILNEFNADERKNFMKFVTGCPRLPKGGNFSNFDYRELKVLLLLIKGFKNLNPKLTVVKKSPNQPNQTSDHILPSVMT